MKTVNREEVAKLYTAFFNRAPESSGLAYWAEDSGLSLSEIARSFFEQPETQDRYPESLDNDAFVKAVYNNLFNRMPDAEGLAYWIAELDQYEESSGEEGVPRNEMILAVMNGARDLPEDEIYDATILTHKMEVGIYFANAGLEYVDFYLNEITKEVGSVEDAKMRVDIIVEEGSNETVLLLDDVIAEDGVVDLNEAMSEIVVAGHAYTVANAENPIETKSITLLLNGKSFDTSVNEGAFTLGIEGANFASDADMKLEGVFSVEHVNDSVVETEDFVSYQLEERLEDVTKLYAAFFNRAPDSEGLRYWVEDSGLDLELISKSFFSQDETEKKYPHGLSDEDFVKAIYGNLFNHEPDEGGLAYWVAELRRYEESGGEEGIPREKMILAVMNGAQNDPEEGVHDATILDHKTEVGLYFSMGGLMFTDFSLHEITEDIQTKDNAIDIIDSIDPSEEDDSYIEIILDENITEDDVINSIEAGETIAITGYVFTADMVDGNSVETKEVILSVNGNEYTGIPEMNRFSIDVPGSELVTDSDHAIDVTYKVIYEGGYTVQAEDTEGYSVAYETPDVPTIFSPVAEDDMINLNEESDFLIEGETAIGTTVHITIRDENGNEVSIVASDNGAILPIGSETYGWVAGGIDVGTLYDGSLTISAVAVDDATNNSSEASTTEVVLDTSLPYLNNVGLTDETNSGWDGGNTTNINPPALEGYAEPGSKVTVQYEDEEGEQQLQSVTAGVNGQFAVLLTENLTEGTTELSVQSTDIAGNHGELLVYDIDIDTTIGIGSIDLTEASDWGESDTDNLTGDTMPVFRIGLNADVEAGNVVQLGTREGGEPVFHTFAYVMESDLLQGYMEIMLPNDVVVESGEKVFVAEVKDAANNTAITDELMVTFDTTAPDVWDIGLTEATDSAVIGDNITYVNTPTIKGVTEAGASAVIAYIDYMDNWITKEGVADENGNFAIALTDHLPEGVNLLEVTVTDVAGNSIMETYTVEVDTSAQVGILDLMDESDTGDSNFDDLTSDRTPTFMLEVGYDSKVGDQVSLTMEDGDMTTILLSRGLIQEEIDQGYALITMSSIETAGTKEFYGTLTDTAGNSTRTEVLDVTFEFTTPEAPSVMLMNDSGESGDDRVTNDATLEVIASEDQNRLEYSLNGIDWSDSAPDFETDGEYEVQVRENDEAGNQSESASLQFTLDTTAPDIWDIGLTDETNSGSDEDDITNFNMPTIEGMTEEGMQIAVSYQDPTGNPHSVEGRADENGHFAIALTEQMPEGMNVLEITATDIAGNSNMAVYEFQVDTVVPEAPEVALSFDTGSSDSDGITSEAFINIDKSDENDGIEYSLDNGTTWGDIIVEFNTEGAYDLWVREYNEAGNRSAITSLPFTLDTTAPDVWDIGLTEPTDSGVVGDDITNVSTPTIKGLTEAGAAVVISYTDTMGNWMSMEGAADSQGNFEIPLSSYLPEGENLLEVTATDVAGNNTMVTYTVEVDTSAQVGILDLMDESDTGDSNFDDLTSDRTPTFMLEVGYDSKVGDQVSLTMEDGDMTTILLSRGLIQEEIDQGYALITMSSIETAGTKEFYGTLTDTAGNSTRTEVLDVTFEFTTPEAPSVMLMNDSGESGDDRVTNDADLEVMVSDNTDILEYSLNGVDWSSSEPLFDIDGEYNVEVREYDEAGNRSETVSLQFTLDTTAPTIVESPMVEEGSTNIFLGIDEEGWAGVYDDATTLIGTKSLLGIENGSVYEGSVSVSAQSEIKEGVIIVEDIAGNTTESGTEKIVLGTDGVERLMGESGNDFIFGFNGGDTLDGYIGNDTLVAGEGNDILYGAVGDDTLYGGIGDDELYGGVGKDTLSGGEGEDLFWFADSGDTGTSYNEIDVITDFISGTDTIDFDSLSTGSTRLFGANYMEDTNISLSSAIDSANDWFTDGNSKLYYISYVSLDHSIYVLVDGDGDQNVDSIVELAGIDLDGISASDITG